MITFDEAIQGTEKNVEIRRPEMCSECNGSGAKRGTKPVKCTDCNGSGEVRRTQQSILGSFVNVTACETCQGKGETIAVKCPVCHGEERIEKERTLRVKIPAGVDSDTQIRLTGEGAPGHNGGPPGNLFVVISVGQHDYLVRDGKNVLLELPIQPEQAKKGGKIEVPTAYGWSTLTIPANTKHGDKITLRGQGTKDVRKQEEKPGDQIVQVLVTDPEALPQKSKPLFNMTNKSYRRSRR